MESLWGFVGLREEPGKSGTRPSVIPSPEYTLGTWAGVFAFCLLIPGHQDQALAFLKALGELPMHS